MASTFYYYEHKLAYGDPGSNPGVGDIFGRLICVHNNKSILIQPGFGMLSVDLVLRLEKNR
jgi:hypothetical protein